MFGDFKGYVDFFLLQDLVDEYAQVKFYLPFDDFKNPPVFSIVDDYLCYKRKIMNFIEKRNIRISKLA